VKFQTLLANFLIIGGFFILESLKYKFTEMKHFPRLKLLRPSRERTPDPNPPNRKPDIHPRLRKRLVMSPEKNPKELGHYIARKLRNLGTFETAGKA